MAFARLFVHCICWQQENLLHWFWFVFRTDILCLLCSLWKG